MTSTLVERADLTGAAGPADHDLVFVGAGASTAYVLLALLAGLRTEAPGPPRRIAVVERAPDPFSGVAYGSRAARTSLLITPLRDFLPEDERALFVPWLTQNKDWVFDEFLASAGPLAGRWWARHRAEIQRGAFDSLYLPRYVFGTYLMRRTRSAIASATAAGVATVDLVQDAVRSIEQDGDSYALHGTDGVVHGRHVVLATGSAPVRPRLPDHAETPPAVLVDDPFDEMGTALERIRHGLERAARRRAPHVVLIGANAGTMDMLFQINDLRVAALRNTTFTILSPRGELPERFDRSGPARPFTAARLLALEDSPDVPAAALYRAALDDIGRGRAAGLTVADTLPPISQALGRVVRRLSPDQAVEFAGRWGIEIGRYQRRAGGEYCDVVEELTAQDRLSIVAGSFTDVVPGEGTVTVRYADDGVLRELDRPADVVVNCGGPGKLLTDADASLPARLIERGLCRATPFGGGIAVDASLAAAPRLYVMGPLLAGNLVKGAPVWHMEHCGRISSFGWALGTDLARTLTTNEG